ncbi:MAG: VOC family protein [Actinomycetota bacterium]|jgi:predicted enzyme related to lactoylglutathione lyase
MAMATVRYIAHDVGTAARFYADHLGFQVELQPAPGFAMLSRGDLRLLLNAPGGGGAGQAAADGRTPEPGGWSRFQLEVTDLDSTVAGLEAAGCTFRTPIVDGAGGRQALVEDPSGNVVELFQPMRAAG